MFCYVFLLHVSLSVLYFCLFCHQAHDVTRRIVGRPWKRLSHHCVFSSLEPQILLRMAFPQLPKPHLRLKKMLRWKKKKDDKIKVQLVSKGPNIFLKCALKIVLYISSCRSLCLWQYKLTKLFISNTITNTEQDLPLWPLKSSTVHCHWKSAVSIIFIIRGVTCMKRKGAHQHGCCAETELTCDVGNIFL